MLGQRRRFGFFAVRRADLRMRNVSDSLREGHYARKQIFCRDRLISWSHRSRFEIGLDLARQFAGKRILDYGCGDGTFLGMLMPSSERPSKAIGAETQLATVKDCRARFGSAEGLGFVEISELDSPGHKNAYDALFCMEVLEHVIDVEPLLDLFERLLAPDGKLLISVPVETGLPLIVKQTVRRVAGWRGIGDYPGTGSYTMRELAAGVFAGRRQHITRPVLDDGGGMAFHDHKGFNWMALRESLTRRFVIEQTLSSPVAWLTPHLASQVWFVARRRGHRH